MFGIDISSWNPWRDPQKTFSGNHDEVGFVIARAAYGAIPDKRFQNNSAILARYPKVVAGAYLYLVSGAHWKIQADMLLSALARSPRKYDFLALDVESSYNQKSKNFALAALKFVDYVSDKTGKPILLYTNYGVYTDWLRPYSSRFDDLPLWIASYLYNSWTQRYKRGILDGKLSPYMPKTRNDDDWFIWQVTASADGNELGFDSRSLDLDYVRDWDRFLGFVGKDYNDDATQNTISIEQLANDIVEELAQSAREIIENRLRDLWITQQSH